MIPCLASASSKDCAFPEGRDAGLTRHQLCFQNPARGLVDRRCFINKCLISIFEINITGEENKDQAIGALVPQAPFLSNGSAEGFPEFLRGGPS